MPHSPLTKHQISLQEELTHLFHQAEQCHRMLGHLIQQRSNLVYWKSLELLDIGEKIKTIEGQLNLVQQLQRERNGDATTKVK